MPNIKTLSTPTTLILLAILITNIQTATIIPITLNAPTTTSAIPSQPLTIKL